MLSCPQCQKVARITLKDRAPLVSIPIVSEPMQEWVMNFDGPFDLPSRSGKKYVLIRVDAQAGHDSLVSMSHRLITFLHRPNNERKNKIPLDEGGSIVDRSHQCPARRPLSHKNTHINNP